MSVSSPNQSRLTESYEAGPPVLAVTPPVWDPTPSWFGTVFIAPSATKNTEDTNLPNSSSTDSVEGHGDSNNGVDTSMFPDPTARSQRTNALADDERFIQRSKEVPARAGFLFYVIHKLLVEDFHFHFCPKARELWLRILEGKTDDDVWLWVEGDEEWLRENPVPYRETTRMNAWSLSESDLVDAQSALRCRVAKQRYPTVTGRHGSRNERVYNATPAQRVCAIAWIIAGSRGVGELFASHGRTPPTFRPPRIADILSHIVGECWDAFSAQTSTWDNALAKSKEDGCICSPVASRGMKQWFNMMVWLEDTPPTLEVGYKPCARCRSLLESRYEVIVAERTEVLHVSLLNALLAYYSRSFSTHESPTAESLVTRKLEPLMEKHRPDLRYLPCVNKYPHSLREHVAKQFCKWKNNDFPAVRFPDHILDGAHDRWVVLGIIALTTYRDPAGKETYLHDKDRDLHAKGWHDLFSSRVRASRDCFSLPLLPRLSATSVRLCHELDQDYSEQRLFDPFSADMGGSDWVYPDRDRRQLRLSTAVFVAVATFLWDKDVDLHGCRRCQNICKEFLADTSSSGALGGANSGEREGLRSPSLPTRGEGDALGRDQALPLNGSLQVRMLEPAGIEVFTSMLHHSTLSKDEKQSRLVWGLHKLKQCGDSLGLNMSDYFQLCLEESAPPSRSPEQGTSSSSKLSKSDKIEQIKDRLLDMLKELGLPYERLPWYTLEKDLEKNGFTVINWPSGVLRKRGNRGIHDLTAVEVNKLYEAITCPEETRRLSICRSQTALTVVPVQPVNRTLAVASSSKRPVPEESDFDGPPSKRMKFKDMTSKVFQQNLTTRRDDGAAG